jgi:hypothetical protein
MMQGSAVAPPHQVGRWNYVIAAMVLGAAGSMIGLEAFASHTYRVGPLIVEFDVRPSTSGTTELGVRPAIAAIPKGVVKRKTHQGFLAVRASVVGVVTEGRANIEQAVTLVSSPATMFDTIQEQGKDAMRRFGLRVGLLTLGGGASGGFIIALVGMKTRRVFQGVLAGVVLVGGMGIVAWQTYDEQKFDGTQFRPVQALEQILRR